MVQKNKKIRVYSVNQDMPLEDVTCNNTFNIQAGLVSIEGLFSKRQGMQRQAGGKHSYRLVFSNSKSFYLVVDEHFEQRLHSALHV